MLWLLASLAGSLSRIAAGLALVLLIGGLLCLLDFAITVWLFSRRLRRRIAEEAVGQRTASQE